MGTRVASEVRRHREAARLPVHFDKHLAQLLQMALVDLEAGRSCGQPNPSMFETIVRRVCPAGETFKAVPVQFNHLQVSLYWPALSDRQTARELLAAPAAVFFAIRARVTVYPEGAIAAWVMLAARGAF